jgi:hypothetical protein
MIKLVKSNLEDDEMRAFYHSLGISALVTEAAIKVRHDRPLKRAGRPPLLKGTKRKAIPIK